MRQSAAKLLVSQAAILLCASLVSLQPADSPPTRGWRLHDARAASQIEPGHHYGKI